MTEANKDPIAIDKTNFSSYYCRADETVELKIMQWLPEHPESNDPVIFVSGWVSVVSGWKDLLRSLAPKQPVFYIETREKKSARVAIHSPTPNDFSIFQMSKDLVRVCKDFPVNMDRSILMGSSLGATAILEALKNDVLKARAAFLIGPNTEFKGPPVLRHLIHLPHQSYFFIRYIILWYLKMFRVDTKKEPEQMQRYIETLHSPHTQRITLSARAAISMKYQVWPDIETIQTPVALAYAPTDKLHSTENIQNLAAALPKGVGIPCDSNKYMHSARILDDLYRFLSEV